MVVDIRRFAKYYPAFLERYGNEQEVNLDRNCIPG